jgi:hypothetical protein
MKCKHNETCTKFECDLDCILYEEEVEEDDLSFREIYNDLDCNKCIDSDECFKCVSFIKEISFDNFNEINLKKYLNKLNYL